MERKGKEGMNWLEFELLQDCAKIRHGIFLRGGGSSPEPYASFNLGDRVGDAFENVQQHLKKVSSALHVPTFTWVTQVHGSRILHITKETTATSAIEADAMITALSNVGLIVHHADCQAAIIYDPIHHVVANVHCGWRGNVQNIYAAVINEMQETYGSHVQDLLVCISPSLGPENTEFINYKTELPPHFWGNQVKPNYFDLWEISENQLVEAGILAHHIEIARICTHANADDYFSYRRDKVTGRNGTVVALV